MVGCWLRRAALVACVAAVPACGITFQGGASSGGGSPSDDTTTPAPGGQGPVGGKGPSEGGGGSGEGGSGEGGSGEGGRNPTPGTTTVNSQPNAMIPYGAFDGSEQTMFCDVLTVSGAGAAVVDVVLTTAVGHAFVGDLSITVTAPDATFAAVLSMPGVEEATVAEFIDGDSSNLLTSSPITFVTDADDDAEDMGDTIPDEEVICQDDGICVFDPNPGIYGGAGLADLVGAQANGMWKVCFGDVIANDTFNPHVQSIELIVTSR
jgi:hypothetical protein